MGINTIERAKIKAFITGFLSDPAHDNQSSRSMTAEVFRIALASLEAEAAIIVGDDGGDALAYRRLIQTFAPGTKLYTAPPAPVVPDEKPIPNPLKMYAVDAVAAIAEVRGWNACRAAMLNQEKSNG